MRIRRLSCRPYMTIDSAVTPRAGFTKKVGDKVVPDEEAIKKSITDNYKGWYEPDDLVEWKKDAKGGTIVEYGKEEEQKGW